MADLTEQEREIAERLLRHGQWFADMEARSWADAFAPAVSRMVEEARKEERERAATFAGFSRANLLRCESPDGFNHALSSWSLSDWFTAVVGELGEAANVAKKLNRVRDGVPGNAETPEQLREMLRHEVADAFIYLDLLAQAAGFDLGSAVLEKFDITSRKRGYPVRLSPVPAPEREEKNG